MKQQEGVMHTCLISSTGVKKGYMCKKACGTYGTWKLYRNECLGVIGHPDPLILSQRTAGFKQIKRRTGDESRAIVPVCSRLEEAMPVDARALEHRAISQVIHDIELKGVSLSRL